MKNLVIFGAAVIMAIPHPASAQIGGIAATATVGSVASTLDQTIRNTMTTVNNSVSSDSFVIRQQLELMLSQVDSIANGQRDKLFIQLDKTQQDAFRNIANSIEQMGQTSQITLDKVQQTSDIVSVNLSNIPFFKDQPKVTRYAPSYIVSGNTDMGSEQSIDIKGVLLSYGNPSLSMNGLNCKISTKIDTDIKFVCPAASWTATTSTIAIDGDLVAFKKPGFWAGLLGKKPIPVPYKLSVFVVPKSLGTYKVSAVHLNTITNHNPRSQPYDVKNGHCSGAQDFVLPFNVTPGWSILPSSINPNCSGSNNSTCQGLRNITNQSFGMAGHVENGGTCGVSLFGGHAWSDAQGEIQGTMTWDEVQDKDVPATDDLGTGTLEWGKSVPIILHSKTQNVLITIDQINGQKIILSSTNNTQKWFSVDVDLNKSSVVISPKTVYTAMQ